MTNGHDSSPGDDSSPAQRGRPGGGSPLSLEQQLLRTLTDAQAALAGAQLHEAAQLMQTANTLCELAVREPALVSRSGLAEIQRLFAICVEAGRPLQEQLMQRMAEHATVAKAAKAYRPKRAR